MNAMLSRRGWLLLLTACLPAIASASPELLSRLRGGGLVILLRHATAPGTGDPPSFRLDDCATQRNLSEAGRAQARAIGAAIRREGVPIGRVLSSRWCRCLDTARLLDIGPVVPFPPLDSFFGEPQRQDEQTQVVRAGIRSWRGPGNQMLVTHQVNITALSGIYPASGEAVVLEPSGAIMGRFMLS
jgi:phosphohistidine phosphatase SixA